MDFIQLIKKIIAENKQIAVVGMGISGIETVLFLKRIGANCLCIEGLEREQYFKKNPNAGKTMALGEVHWNADTSSLPNLTNVSLAIVSPGYSPTKPIIAAINEKKIPTVTEFELGLLLYKKPTILVTGSNGKSTVVSLIQHLLTSVGKRALLVGNIGTPVVSGIKSLESQSNEIDLLVVEASSYQLELCHYFTPDVAVFLNLSPNHLERHGSMEAYYQAKASVFKRQAKNQLRIINGKDVYGKRLLEEVGGADFSTDTQNYDAEIKGEHNRLNIAAALSACEAFGVARKELLLHLKSFVALPHRYERLPSVNGTNWINDSKSTTPIATVAAVKTFLEKEGGDLIVLLGGQSKQGSWQEAKAALTDRRIKKIIYFGQDGEKISKQLLAGEVVKSLNDAIVCAKGIANTGDTVLLSPGCASFDEFSSFEARGDFFRKNAPF